MASGRSAGRAPWPDFVEDFVRKNFAWLAELGFIPSHHTPIRAAFHHPGKGILLTATWDPWDVCMDLSLGPALGRPRQEVLAYPLFLYGEALEKKDARWSRKIREAAKDGTFKALRRLLQELMPRYDEVLPEVAHLWRERTGEPAQIEAAIARPSEQPKPIPHAPRGAPALTQRPWFAALLLTIGYGIIFGYLSLSMLLMQRRENPRMQMLKTAGVSRLARVELRRFGPYRLGWAEAVVESPSNRIKARVLVYARHQIGDMVPVLCDRSGCVEAERVDLHVRYWPFTPQAILCSLGLLVWALVPWVALRFGNAGARPRRGGSAAPARDLKAF